MAMIFNTIFCEEYVMIRWGMIDCVLVLRKKGAIIM